MNKKKKNKKEKRIFLRIAFVLLLLMVNSFLLKVSAQVASFPGAQGGGASSIGGRGGEVYYVTTLADSGPGSLRTALEDNTPRYVLFKVGGVIKLLTPIEIGSYKTIAGQTAPGGGITITAEVMTKIGPLFYIYLQHDVIVRNITMRYGVNSFTWTDLRSDPSIGQSCIAILGSHSIVIDQCTATWGNVGMLGAWSADGNTPSRKISWQWNLISESPYSNQSTATNIGGDPGALCDFALDLDVHHNFYTANGHRNPVMKTGRGRVINNITANWGWYGIGFVNGAKVDIIGNLLKETTRSTADQTIVYEGDASDDGPSGNASIYIAGNRAINQTNPNADNWTMIKDLKTNINAITTYKRSPFIPFSSSFYPYSITIDNVDSLENKILPVVGNCKKLNADGSWTSRRDTNDRRVIANYQNNTSWSITTQNDVGGYPTIAGGTSYVDSDNDGMPDLWETANGFNNTVNDANGDADGDGYKNIEEFLNGSGISEAGSGTTGKISVHPNPTSGLARISFGLTITKEASIQVTDVNGKVISNFTSHSSTEFLDVNLSFLSPGIYFAILRTNKEKQIVKIIKK